MLNIDKHRILLMKIIKDIFTSKYASQLAFKWWTASYFLYWLDRFSTDLDFDFFWKTNIDDWIAEILQQYGKVKKGQKIVLSYWDQETNIKIDISRKVRSSNKYDIVDFYWTGIKVQTKATLFTNKLVALSERFTNRDIYDVYFFFTNLFDIDESIIYERTGKGLKDLLQKILKKLEWLPKNYKILDWLWELLNDKQKLFVKNKLVSELIGIIKMKIDFYEGCVIYHPGAIS